MPLLDDDTISNAFIAALPIGRDVDSPLRPRLLIFVTNPHIARHFDSKCRRPVVCLSVDVPEWSKGQDLGSCINLRGFKSHRLHPFVITARVESSRFEGTCSIRYRTRNLARIYRGSH